MPRRNATRPLPPEASVLSLPRIVGCPISRSFFARCGRPRTLTFFPTFKKKQVECCGIPYLAKNERDMGHPTILGRDKTLSRAFLYRRPNRNTKPVVKPRFFTCGVLLKVVNQYPGCMRKARPGPML